MSDWQFDEEHGFWWIEIGGRLGYAVEDGKDAWRSEFTGWDGSIVSTVFIHAANGKRWVRDKLTKMQGSLASRLALRYKP